MEGLWAGTKVRNSSYLLNSVSAKITDYKCASMFLWTDQSWQGKALHNYSNTKPSHMLARQSASRPNPSTMPSQVNIENPVAYKSSSWMANGGRMGGGRTRVWHSGITVCRQSSWCARTLAILLCRALKRGTPTPGNHLGKTYYYI